jgi:ABC-type sugar transport system ATPase subunit
MSIINRSKILNDVNKNRLDLNIKMISEKDMIDSLSGGNKQKILVSRLLNHRLNYYLFDELTEGIDIETRASLLRFIRENLVADSGILLVSNVVADLIGVCDRIAVMYHGEIVKQYSKNEFSEHNIYLTLQGIT